jgi:hypothetical protein
VDLDLRECLGVSYCTIYIFPYYVKNEMKTPEMVDAQEEGSPSLEEPSLASRLVNLETQRLMGQSVFLQ